jgi:hypothetical protein
MSTTDEAIAIGQRAKVSARVLAKLSTEVKNRSLCAMADRLERESDFLIQENHKDLGYAQEKGLSKALMDRVALNPQRIVAMASGIREVVALPDPVREITKVWRRPNGLGIGILKAIFVQSEKYRRGRGMSITPVSALKMRRAGCEKGLPDPCAPDLRKDCDTVGALRCVKGKPECWLRNGVGWRRIGSQVGSGRVKKRIGLYRGTGWGSLGQAQMSEDLGDHRWIYDGGDNRQGSATLRTGCHVDLEHPFEK